MSSPIRQNVLSLTSYSSEEELPFFLAIEMKNPCWDFLQIFTPKVMQWDESTWLFDLRPCLSYWHQQARQQRKSPLAFIEEVLLSQGLDDWFAVLAPHPWQGVLLLHALQKKANLAKQASKRLISLVGPFGAKLWSTLSWQDYRMPLSILGNHWAALERPGFQSQRFHRQMAQFQRAMGRLGMNNLSQMQAISPEAIKRRFGPYLSEIWTWMYPRLEGLQKEERKQPSLFTDKKDAPFLEDFPWLGIDFSEAVKVQRYLDDPLHLWAQYEPYLIDDLDRLGAILSENDRVLSLSWQLIFASGRECSLHLGFKYPHSLQREKGTQKTALSQAAFAFEQLMAKLRQREDDLNFPAELPLVAWVLRVSEKICLSPSLPSLFNGGDEKSLSKLWELENKLSRPLQRYALATNFTPLSSYCLAKNSTSAFPPGGNFWSLAAEKRPLFIYEEAKPLQIDLRRGKKIFLERTPTSWWQDANMHAFAHDFYLYVDSDGKSYWIKKGEENNWYAYGLYS